MIKCKGFKQVNYLGM